MAVCFIIRDRNGTAFCSRCKRIVKDESQICTVEGAGDKIAKQIRRWTGFRCCLECHRRKELVNQIDGKIRALVSH